MALAPVVPVVPFEQVATRVDRLWHPDRAPHHVMFAQTRAGKTHLIAHGLLPLMAEQRVLILDAKGDDPLWGRMPAGRRPAVVTRLAPAFGQDDDGGGPLNMHYRFDVQGAGGDPKRVARRVLDQVDEEGHCTLIVDEAHTVGHTWGLGDKIEKMMRTVGSRNCCMILATQTIGWAGVALKDQGSFYWIGHTEDQARQKRLLDIVGQPPAFLPVLQSVERGHWLYTDTLTGTRVLAITTPGHA